MGTYSVRGSGTVFKRNGRTYVLTAAHVVEELKQVIEDDENEKGKRLLWRDAWVVLERVKDGRKTGELRLLAKVVFATKSEEDGGDDVAVLEVYEGDLFPHSAVPLPKIRPFGSGRSAGMSVRSMANSLIRSVAASSLRLGACCTGRPSIRLPRQRRRVAVVAVCSWWRMMGNCIGLGC
jgi:hypothetical protein